jgi:alpha-tubulin suppressor-like RCC1 family protein
MRALRSAWLARHRDGRYEALVWGAEPPTVPREATIPDGIRNDHICYVLPDTSMRCLGYNEGGKIGNGSSSWPEDVTAPWDPGLCGVRSIATGGTHTCAVLADRRVWCWGDTHNDRGGDPATERCVGVNMPVNCVTRPTLVEGIDQVERLFVGTWNTCAIRADRSVWCWGSTALGGGARPTRLVW